MAGMRSNPAGFARLRTLTEALQLSDGDKAGPLTVELSRVNVLQVKRAFSSRGATVASGPWPAWSPAYAAWRKKHGLGSRMLRLTDTMFGKFTSPSHGSYIGKWLGGWSWAFGASDDVASWHQAGAGHLPKRSVIDKTEADKRQFTAALVTFWRKRIRQVLRHA